jgi:hypothetical protein
VCALLRCGASFGCLYGSDWPLCEEQVKTADVAEGSEAANVSIDRVNNERQHDAASHSLVGSANLTFTGETQDHRGVSAARCARRRTACRGRAAGSARTAAARSPARRAASRHATANAG